MPSIHDGETVIRRCVQLATAARELGIHVIGTEENPDGLGPLVPEVAALCDTTLAKFHFSATAEDGFLRACRPGATPCRRRLRGPRLRDADRGRPARAPATR